MHLNIYIYCSVTYTFEYIPISLIKLTFLHEIIFIKSFFKLFVW